VRIQISTLNGGGAILYLQLQPRSVFEVSRGGGVATQHSSRRPHSGWHPRRRREHRAIDPRVSPLFSRPCPLSPPTVGVAELHQKKHQFFKPDCTFFWTHFHPTLFIYSNDFFLVSRCFSFRIAHHSRPVAPSICTQVRGLPMLIFLPCLLFAYSYFQSVWFHF